MCAYIKPQGALRIIDIRKGNFIMFNLIIKRIEDEGKNKKRG